MVARGAGGRARGLGAAGVRLGGAAFPFGAVGFGGCAPSGGGPGGCAPLGRGSVSLGGGRGGLYFRHGDMLLVFKLVSKVTQKR